MESYDIQLDYDEQPFLNALHSLEELAKRFPDAVKRFLKGLPDLSQLFRLNSVSSTAGGTNKVKVVLEPSDRLFQFLSTFPTGNIK